MKVFAGGLLALLLMASPLCAAVVDTIGHIHTLKGTASIVRGGATLAAASGVSLNQGDVVRTGNPGAVSIVMIDDTSVSMGPGSEISLKKYTFDPEAGKFSLVARMVRGTFAYLTGLIGKLAPDSIQLLIPDAIIAVRGTKLLIEVKE
jgi:hypothetical protein